jgi:hypothetical protein
LPPVTVKVCQNLRFAKGPSTMVNSQSSERTSLPGEFEDFSRPLSISVKTVDAAGTQRHRHLGEAAVRDELARVDRLDVVQVEHE